MTMFHSFIKDEVFRDPQALAFSAFSMSNDSSFCGMKYSTSGGSIPFIVPLSPPGIPASTRAIRVAGTASAGTSLLDVV